MEITHKQKLVCSRSFGRRLTTQHELAAALAEFATRAAEKLRRQHSVTRCITIFLRTNPFNQKEAQYQRAASMKLETGTQDTRRIIAVTSNLLDSIFKNGFNYHKCGVQLCHIESDSLPAQISLFDIESDSRSLESPLLMKAMDQINRKFPKAISIAATGFDKTWQPKNDRVSQAYTTNWNQLVTVK